MSSNTPLFLLGQKRESLCPQDGSSRVLVSSVAIELWFAHSISVFRRHPFEVSSLLRNPPESELRGVHLPRARLTLMPVSVGR